MCQIHHRAWIASRNYYYSMYIPLSDDKHRKARDSPQSENSFQWSEKFFFLDWILSRTEFVLDYIPQLYFVCNLLIFTGYYNVVSFCFWYYYVTCRSCISYTIDIFLIELFLPNGIWQKKLIIIKNSLTYAGSWTLQPPWLLMPELYYKTNLGVNSANLKKSRIFTDFEILVIEIKTNKWKSPTHIWPVMNF